MRKRCHRISMVQAHAIYALLLDAGIVTRPDGAHAFFIEVSVCGHKQYNLRHAGYGGIFHNDASSTTPRISPAPGDNPARLEAVNAQLYAMFVTDDAASTKEPKK
jgi:hypothetical protein